GNHGGGSPAISISADNGKTFTAPHVLREFGKGKDYTQSGNLALGVAGDGALVVLAMAYTAGEGNHIFGWRSTDSGKNWVPTDTATLGPNRTGSVFGNFVEIPGTGLGVVGHYRDGSQPYQTGIWLAASNDDGRTWSEPRRISEADAAEPVLVSSAERLIAILRGKARKGQEYVAVSDDHGQHWTTKLSELAPENPKTHSLAAPCAVVNPEKPDELLVLTTERGDPGRIWLWRASAKALDFKRERVLLEFPRIAGDKHSDYGYPWLVPISGRRWMLFYYHGYSRGPNAIWVADVEL
ncbi:MAG TPA: sialidase family protein, partial [Pirellulales bacterium]|nr:sialidase family protein [Pirellulales bacterium]